MPHSLQPAIQFCNFPCTDPFAQAKEQDLPPPRSTIPPDTNTDPFNQTTPAVQPLRKRSSSSAVDHTGDNLQSPAYTINNQAGSGALSDRTAYVDALHANGLVEYDTRKSKHSIVGSFL